MVRASFNINPPKKTRRFAVNTATTLEINNLKTTSMETLYSEIAKSDTKQVESSYAKFHKNLTCLNTRKMDQQKYNLSERKMLLINERKHLFNNKMKKQNIQKITELSKRIREGIRKDRKSRRLQTLVKHIVTIGGTRKVLKELRESNNWIPNLKNNQIHVTNRKDITKIATKFYQNLYSSRDTVNENRCASSIISSSNLNSEPEILPSKVRQAILSQKLDKPPGPDKITNELLKGILEELVLILTKIFNEIISKKKIILGRISIVLDENKPMEQTGFRKSFSTIDHLHTVKQILEKYKEYNKSLYMAFIDYTKAFENISHKAIWQSLEKQGIPSTYIIIMRSIYFPSKGRIQLVALGDEFGIGRGGRQGDPLFPKLFSTVLENIFRKLDWDQYGLGIDGRKLNYLRFTDDIVLFERYLYILKKMIKKLRKEKMEKEIEEGNKWEDEIKLTARANWRRVAKDRKQWKMLEEAYAKRHTELRDFL
ncbi:Retrovirus-related Pol polyprotein from type-2 retrotransposable element R2DM; Endonuclease [Eumeta japonica]|uniref:Retrovirus-related Pol polyprotein from type-2 retrotransposable element R2DM Endonuclease n=1 Tax=Eumeta variegata TaxID=151549 RepID=A0A4C1TPF2_EUMVA|nr:Retrovirus-related Pol polyprotein from type-2 retrotransposable element R2DM; Endonuclease [Eumeta japonica]